MEGMEGMEWEVGDGVGGRGWRGWSGRLGMEWGVGEYLTYMYRSLAKECPWSNFLHRVKVYLNECPPWSELCVDTWTTLMEC